MKPQIKYIAAAVALAGSLAFINQAAADPHQIGATITAFQSFTSDTLYPSWDTATINSTPTNYVITATGYGSNYKYIGGFGINGIGCTNIQLDVTLSASSTNANGQLGPIVELLDGNGNDYSYAWYGLTLGHHVLNMPIESPTFKSGSGPLNLANLLHMHMKLDPGGYGSSGTYTVSWNNLILTGPKVIADLAVTNASITAFNGFASDALYPSWDTATIATNGTSYILTATGYGSNYKYIGYPQIKAIGCTNIELDCFISGPAGANGNIGPIVELIDADGTDYKYAWYGQTLGHHTLTLPIESPTYLVSTGSTPGLNLTNILYMHMAVDPGGFGTSGAYTVSWNNLRFTGGISDTNAQNLTTFTDYIFDSVGGNWPSATIVTNTQGYQFIASGYGTAYKSLATTVDASGNANVQLTMNFSSADSTASGKLGAIVKLFDNNGNVLAYAWYGQSLGELVLTQTLNSGTWVISNTPAFNFSALTGYRVEVDPSSFVGTYTAAWEQLDLTGTATVLSTNAQLTSLALTPAGTLYPAFVSGTTGYTATNTCANNPITVAVTNADLTATNWLIYNGTTNQLSSGSNSAPLTLFTGVNNVTVQVVSQDLSITNNYSVAVTLTTPPTVTVNSASIYEGGSAILTATNNAASPSYLWSDSETTASITVSPGLTTNYTVVVTDGTTSCAGGGSGIVTVLPSTNALLASLSISPGALSQTFNSGTTNYTATNNYGQNPVTVAATSADAKATLALSFTNGVYGAAVTNSLSVSGNNLQLNPPVNPVAVRVVSQDLSQTNVYTVNVLLQPSLSVPHLTNSLSGNNLVFSWPADHLGYRLLVQTNNLNKGVSGNTNDWGTVANSTTITATNIAIIKTGVTNEYYKLVYP